MAKRKQNYIIKPKDDVILNEVKDPSAKVLRCAQDDKFALLDNIEQLGIDHKDLVDPKRRKFLINSISSSTALSAEMKFSLITGILSLFAPKKAFSQMIPFAFWKSQGPLEPPTFSFGSLEVWSWGNGWDGTHSQNDNINRSTPVQITGTWDEATTGRQCRFFMKSDGTAWGVGKNGVEGYLGIGSHTHYSSPIQIPGDWKKIVGNFNHVMGIRDDGTLWAWGYNNHGQLGQTNLNSHSSPVQVSSDTDWDFVHPSESYSSFAIKEDGRLFAWGFNQFGHLGTGNTTKYSSPVQVGGSWKQVSSAWGSTIGIRTDDTLWGWGAGGYGQLGQVTNTTQYFSPVQITTYKFKDAHMGQQHAIVLREDNTAWTMGQNTNGQLGNGNTNNQSSPTQIPGIWTAIGAGGHCCAAVGSDGTIWTWGQGNWGALGNDNDVNQSSPVQEATLATDWTDVDVDTVVTGMIGIKGDVTSSGSPISFVNTTPGTLWVWGQNNSGQLGRDNITNYSSPVQLSSEYHTQVATLWGGTLVLRSDGTLWGAGYNSHGQLGQSSTANMSSPVQIDGSWKMISGDKYSVAGIKDDNTLWTWGYNDLGQLGHESLQSASSPIQVAGGGSWKYISIGSHNAFGIKSDGSLWAWGDNAYGNLAQETNLTLRSSPVQIGSDTNWVKVQSQYFGVALKDDGSLWAWGYGADGCLGQNSLNNYSSPVQLSGSWYDFALNDNMVAAIKSNKTLWCWGLNSAGHVGNNTTNNVSSPIQITSYKWKSVGGNDTSTFAVREDGTLWAWGNNNNGQLGMNDTIWRSAPVQVSTETDWILSSSSYHTVAIRGVTTGGSGGATLSVPSQLLATPGNLWGNGYGGHGRLGQETTNVNMSSPVQVAGLWRGISSGGNFNVAIRDDYTLWNWGRNNKGQLGQGNFTNTSSPVQVSGSWIACAAQDEGTFGIRSDGTLWAWGYNSMADGMLGIDNTGINNANSPLQVDGSWTFVAAGAYHGGGIKTDGTLWMWGYARYGCIGDDTNTTRPSPVQIGSGTDWIALHCCDYNTMALKSDYTLWAWGANDHGMLAQPTHNNHESSPVQIDGSWIQFTTAYSAGAGIKTDGTLWVWGWNGTNLLGTGDSTDHSSPVQIAGSWLQVEGDQQCFRAIKNDGTCWVWGEGSTGRLGLNSNADRTTPIQLGNEDDWLKVDASKFRGQWGIRYTPPQKTYSVWTWGYNNAGGLGLIDREWRSSPVQVPGEWKDVSGGLEHVLAIRDDDTLWSWGWGNYGALGLNSPSSESSPVQVGSETWRDVCGGGDRFSHAIRTNNTLWAWGLNWGGQLGTGDVIYRSSPVQVGSTGEWWRLAEHGGWFHSGAIKLDGTLWTWGAYWSGRLGNGASGHESSPVQVTGGGSWVMCSFGNEHSAGIKKDGTLWVWGGNSNGQLGLNNTTTYFQPTQLGTHTWKSVRLRQDHAVAIRSDDTIWVWGYNGDGQIGVGDTAHRSSPVQISGYGKAVGTGRGHTMIIRDNGTLWAAGTNNEGELGLGTTSSSENTFKKVGQESDWVRIENHRYESSIALRDNVTSSSFELWVWGWNGYGQLGPNGTVGQNASSPIQIPGNWVKASFGNELVMANRADGSHATWGWGVWGMLGHGNTNNLSAPEMLPGGFTEFNSGWNQNLWVRDNGTLWSAGRNNYGQLGIGNTQNQSSPVQIGTDTDWASCDAAERFQCFAVKTDGTLWVWGRGTDGRLGNNSTNHLSSPVQVAGSWSQVTGGATFTVGIQTDGTMWSWGLNNNGQLGQGNTTNRSSPVQIGGSWSQVSTGYGQTIALRPDGTAWTWGMGSNGILGNGGTNNASSPVQIAGSWKVVAAGDEVTAGIKDDDTLWIWGRNTWGQLGQVSNLNNQSSPVQIPGRFADVQIGSYRNVLALKKKGS